jgi:hypothetical protein
MGLLAAGAGLALGGTALGAIGAQDTKRQLGNIANTPFINPADSQKSALTGDLANLGQSKDLVGQENQFSADQLHSLLNSSIPGFDKLQSTRSANAQSLLSGQIPPDVAAAIQRSDAAKSLTGGYAGSGAARDLTARDFGLTSLDLMNQGNTQTSGIIGSTPLAHQQDIGALQINPGSVYSEDVNQRAQKIAAAQAAANSGGAFGKISGAASGIGGGILGSVLG